MSLHQRFRLGNEEVEYLAVRQDDNGPPYSRLDDIHETFPGASRFKVNGITLNFLTDRNGNRFEPMRVAHYPGNTIDVFCATSTHTPSANAPVSLPVGSSSGYREPSVSNLSHKPSLSANAPRSPAPSSQRSSTTDTHRAGSPSDSMAVLSTIASDIVHMQQQLVQATDRHSIYHQQLLDRLIQLPREEQVEATERDEKMLAELAAAKERDAEILKLQQVTIDNLRLAKQRIDAVMVQNYELHEYNIPRLFIILPESYEKWNPLKFVNERFRLHFLCEGGEHYKADSGHGGSSDLNRINNTTSTATGRVRVKSDIHLAHHEGYEISRPITFFEHYGPYALAILRILKHTWTIPSVVTPETQGSLDDVVRRVEAVDMSIGFLEQKLDDTKALDEKGDREDRKEERVFERLVALEGADLRRLETFLRNKDKDKILGNLYRITTEVGHVKWVCRDHYRQGYCNTASSSPLQSSEANGANYDPLIDDVTVELKLRTAPRDFLSRVSSRASTIMSSRSI